MKKVLYIIRIILFLLQFYLVFSMLNNILQIGLVGYIFMLLYFIYIIKIITELLSKKKSYQKDFVYNFMQIGFAFYLLVIFLKVYFEKIVVIGSTMGYFNINYIILSLLMTFILIYSILELQNNK